MDEAERYKRESERLYSELQDRPPATNRPRRGPSFAGLRPFHAFARIQLGRNATEEEEGHAELFWPAAIEAR